MRRYRIRILNGTDSVSSSNRSTRFQYDLGLYVWQCIHDKRSENIGSQSTSVFIKALFTMVQNGNNLNTQKQYQYQYQKVLNTVLHTVEYGRVLGTDATPAYDVKRHSEIPMSILQQRSQAPDCFI